MSDTQTPAAAGETTDFTIGGRVWSAPPMVFFTLERAWPHIQAMAFATDPIEVANASLNIIVAALGLTAQPPSLTELKMLLLPSEMGGLQAPLKQLFERAGLEAKRGAPEGEAVATGSAETSAA